MRSEIEELFIEITIMTYRYLPFSDFLHALNQRNSDVIGRH